MSSKKRQPIPTVRDQRTLAEALTPRTQEESWAVLVALRAFVSLGDGFNLAPNSSGRQAVLRAMLARSEGLE